MLNIKPVFPTALGFAKFDQGFSKKQKDYILNQEKMANHGNLTSKQKYLYKNTKILNNFYDFCLKNLNDYFQEIYRPQHNVQLRITQMWANYNSKGQFHHTHEHPNSFLSAVFYIQCTNNQDNIMFSKKEYRQLSVPSKNFTEFNSMEFRCPVEENLLLIFPSSLTHNVDPVIFDKPRISISMNTFPVGLLGDYVASTECIL